MVDLTGKAVIVTGASSGIGAALARAFSRAGGRVTLAARREDRLREAAGTCPGDTLVVAADLTREKDRVEVVRQSMARWGRIDILVNNAGSGLYGPVTAAAEADWRRIFEINLFSLVLMTREILPVLQSRRSGLVINIASIGGLIAHSENVTPYIASKHAVVGFSRGLARDLAGTGVRVLAVCPHLTDTELFRVSPGAEEMAPVLEKFREFMDTPEDVARGILAQLDSERLVVFPTEKPARAYQKTRDL
jgi:short-subunit dehydrogenase